MSKIVAKLNLNKTPQLVENNSLVMAKNIRLLEDGTIGPDTSLKNIETHTGNSTTTVINNPAVIQEITTYQYTILNPEFAVKVVKNNIVLTDEELESEAYNFTPNRSRGGEPTEETSKSYSKTDSKTSCDIKINSYSKQAVKEVSDIFSYNINEKRLETNSGYVLLLAVRSDIYDDVVNIENSGDEYFYVELPDRFANNIITVNDTEYKVINPVYATNNTIQETISEAYTEEVNTYDTIKYVAQIVGLNNKIYFFKESNAIIYNEDIISIIEDNYQEETFIGQDTRGERQATFDVNAEGYVTRNGIEFENAAIASQITPNINDRIKIFEYDEVTETFTKIKCGWKYSGGKINGCVTVNNTGESILTICEYDVPNGKLVPIKHINVNKCSISDDETIYTQAPNIPITNITCTGRTNIQIPSGVYQFFVRYKIRDNFYTNWFPASMDLFTAKKSVVNTIQGSISYIDLHVDSNQSFKLEVRHLLNSSVKNYEKFQIGFILSHDNGVFARSWKHFDFVRNDSGEYVNIIDFDYDKKFIEDINIDDMLKVNYDLYNVENIANHKNKLYIANFTETDFNSSKSKLYDFAQNIDIQYKEKQFKNEEIVTINNKKLLNLINNTYYSKYEDLDINSNYQEFPISKLYESTGVYLNITINREILEHVVHKEADAYDSDYKALSYAKLKYFDEHAGRWCGYEYYLLDGDNKIQLGEDNTEYEDSFDVNAISYYVPEGYYAGGEFTHQKYIISSIQENFELGDIDDVTLVTDKLFEIVKNKYENIYLNKTNNEYYVLDNGRYLNINNLYATVGIYHYAGYVIEPDGHGNDVKWHKYEREISTAHINIVNKYSIKYRNEGDYEEVQTLLPFTQYDFYCHFVTKNGIITNGYKIRTKYIDKWISLNVPIINGYEAEDIPSVDKVLTSKNTNYAITYVDRTNNQNTQSQTILVTDKGSNSIIYPAFYPKRDIPEGYVGYFISMYKHKNNVSHLTNVKLWKTEENVNYYLGDAIDIDAALNTIYDNITIKKANGEIVTENAVYVASGETKEEFLGRFGDSGFVSFTVNTGVSVNENDNLWIVGNEEINEDYKILTKVTPIKLGNSSHNNYKDIFLDGYYCNVVKLTHEIDNERLYANGSDVYKLSLANDKTGLNVNLEEGVLIINYTNFVKTYSNYNLNYLSLTQDINLKIRNYTRNNEIESQFIASVDSLIASYILTLENTFKDYTRKLYAVKEDNKIVKFDNVVRSSDIDVDETYRYTYRFDPNDYYNVPTNRGIITNLIAVANTLYVHCEHSLFKFSDNKTLNAQDENVNLQENDIFNSGISELFDAQYGFAGLSKREHSLVTYNVYVFYDEVAKTIYALGGEQQISTINTSIKKLIEAVNPTDIQFVADEPHNRFFVNLKNNNGNVCLSYNFTNKDFISVHDIDFNFGFHSRRHTYFVHNNYYDNDVIGWSLYKIVEYIDISNIKRGSDSVINDDPSAIQPKIRNYIAYQNCYTPSLIKLNDCDSVELNSVNAANACVDVIFNEEYESLKVLNSISWICSAVQNYGLSENYVAEEQLNRLYSGNKIRIYSDSTETALFDLLLPSGFAKIANNERNIDENGNIAPNPNSWQYPYYNQGIWFMNYFRDVRNLVDVFGYKKPANNLVGGVNHSSTVNLTEFEQRENLTQENNLIFGKYFVVRFIFNNRNFKLENVILNLNYYGKAK